MPLNGKRLEWEVAQASGQTLATLADNTTYEEVRADLKSITGSA